MRNNKIVLYRFLSISILLTTLGLAVWSYYSVTDIFSLANVSIESSNIQIFVWGIIYSSFASFFIAWRLLLNITIMKADYKDDVSRKNIEDIVNEENKKERKKINWNTIINADNQKTLNNLVRELNIDTARWYTFDNNDKYNNTINYAYSILDNNTDSFKFGEGLIGQVAINRKGLHLSDIPDNYIKITSASGQIIPNNIYIIPIVINDLSTIIIELADMKKEGSITYSYLNDFAEEFANNIKNKK